MGKTRRSLRFCLLFSQPTLNNYFYTPAFAVAYLSTCLSIVNIPRPLEDSTFLPYRPQSGHSGLLSSPSTCVILFFNLMLCR